MVHINVSYGLEPRYFGSGTLGRLARRKRFSQDVAML